MEELNIKGIAIAPGDLKEVRIEVGELPSKTRVYINAIVSRAVKDGPTLLIMGGVHGDEVCGIEIVRSLIEGNILRDINCGAVIAIPMLNAFGFNNFMRDMPDGKDINRSFPGFKRGSLASRVARTLSDHILPHIDIILDFHCGGGQRYNYPQVRYSAKNKINRELAEVFSAPYSIAKPEIKGSLRGEASKRGISVLVYEGGEANRLDGFAIERGVAGIKRVMIHQGMLEKTTLIPARTVHVNKTSWVRASDAGIFKWAKNSGQKINQGEPLGAIYGPYGTKVVVVKSNTDGYIIGHSNAPVVNVGDALFHIATHK